MRRIVKKVDKFEFSQPNNHGMGYLAVGHNRSGEEHDRRTDHSVVESRGLCSSELQNVGFPVSVVEPKAHVEFPRGLVSAEPNSETRF